MTFRGASTYKNYYEASPVNPSVVVAPTVTSVRTSGSLEHIYVDDLMKKVLEKLRKGTAITTTSGYAIELLNP